MTSMHEGHSSTIGVVSLIGMLWTCTLSAADQQSSAAVPHAPVGLSVSFVPAERRAESPLATTLRKISNDVEVGGRILPVYAGDLHRRESVVSLLTGAEKQVIEALADVPDEALRSQLSRRMALGPRRLNHASIRAEDAYIPKIATEDALRQLQSEIERIRSQI